MAMAAELFANLFDTILQTYFILGYIKQPLMKNKHFIGFIILVFISLSVASFYTIYSNTITIGFIILSYLFTLPIKEAKLSDRLMAPALFIVIISTTNLIVIGILSALFNDPDTILMYGTPARYILIAMTKVFLTLTIFVILRFRRLDISLRPAELFTYCVFPLVSFAVVGNFCIIIRDYGLSVLSPMTIFCLAGIIIINFVVMFLFERMTISDREKAELRLLQAQTEYEKEKYTELAELYEQVRAVRHDFSNHIITLSELLNADDSQGAKKYISELNKTTGSGRALITSGNRTLDFIINSKITANSDISFSVTGSADALPDSSIDMTVLIGNLLDNAITAARQSEKKTVDLKLYESEHYRHILCKNTVSESVLAKNPQLKTTKKESGHGLGIRRMRQILEKYSGLLDFYEEGEYFCVQISLPRVSIQTQTRRKA